MPHLLTLPGLEGEPRPMIATVTHAVPEPLTGQTEVTLTIEGGRGSVTILATADQMQALPVGESLGMILAPLAECKRHLSGSPQIVVNTDELSDAEMAEMVKRLGEPGIAIYEPSNPAPATEIISTADDTGRATTPETPAPKPEAKPAPKKKSTRPATGSRASS